MDSLVQGGEEEDQREAVNRQCERQPVSADTDADHIARHEEHSKMPGQLHDPGPIGTPGTRSQSARLFRLFAHRLADGRRHGRIHYRLND